MHLTLSIEEFRRMQRAQAFSRKGSLCDICHEQASEYHEIVSRAQTLNNPLAEAASFSQEVCSILCQNCHANVAGFALELIKYNMEIYGREPVLAKLNEVQSHLKGKLIILMEDI